MPTEEFSFAHLTDTHVTDEASSKLVECAFQEINNLQPCPDFVVIGGDLVANGTRAEFDVFLLSQGSLVERQDLVMRKRIGHFQALSGIQICLPSGHDRHTQEDVGISIEREGYQ